MGLPKSALERNCPKLDESVAEKNRGGYSLQEFARLLKNARLKENMDMLRRELKGKSASEQRRIMLRLFESDSLEPWEVEAVKQIYREKFGEPPKEEP